MSELKSESVQVDIIIEWGLHTEIRSDISQQTFCSPWTYSLQNLVTDSKRTPRQARALVCIFFYWRKKMVFKRDEMNDERDQDID